MTVLFDPKAQRPVLHLLLLLVCGTGGGVLAWLFALPLPFMLGGLMATIVLVIFANTRGVALMFPRLPRKFAVGIIGTMIGSTFSPDLIGLIPNLTLSLVGVAVYVAVAHIAGYAICRKIGRYDPVTSFYAAMPGGLIEAVTLGERGGGDVRILTLTHFLRVLMVVTLVPILFLIWSGDAVGSSAGQAFSEAPATFYDTMIILIIAAFGLALGRILHIPAAHLLGPVILSSVLFGTGIVSAISPTWLLYVAQLFVGIGLGTQFSGATKALMLRVLKTSVTMIIVYLGLTGLIAVVFAYWTGLRLDAMILSFAPGGVSEMGLIALSLSLSPVIVAAHHVFRIFLTVFVAALSTRFFLKTSKD